MQQFVDHYISAQCVRQNLVTKHLIQPIFACLWKQPRNGKRYAIHTIAVFGYILRSSVIGGTYKKILLFKQV